MSRAIVGANWGDEGKGKITDMLAADSDIVVRFQGGSNAGHTIVNEYGKFALHMLPSGVFYQHVTNVIGSGVALNIPYLLDELGKLEEQGVPAPKMLVSDRAQVVMPYHILFDAYEEERLGKASFGSTKSGIAPTYSDKYAKIGICVAYELDGETIDYFPNTQDCYRARPIIRTMPGWKCDIRGIRTYEELPQQTRDYIDEIQRLIGCPVTMISNGPGRNDIIRR